MKIEIGENREFIVKEVYSNFTMETNDKERISICMRDSGFEINYCDTWYSFQNGTVTELGYKNKYSDKLDPFRNGTESPNN